MPSIHAKSLISVRAVLVTVASIIGCGDDDGPTAPPTLEPVRPTTLTIRPGVATLTALAKPYACRRKCVDLQPAQYAVAAVRRGIQPKCIALSAVPGREQLVSTILIMLNYPAFIAQLYKNQGNSD